jgi:hypothetical protein
MSTMLGKPATSVTLLMVKELIGNKNGNNAATDRQHSWRNSGRRNERECVRWRCRGFVQDGLGGQEKRAEFKQEVTEITEGGKRKPPLALFSSVQVLWLQRLPRYASGE